MYDINSIPVYISISHTVHTEKYTGPALKAHRWKNTLINQEYFI